MPGSFGYSRGVVLSLAALTTAIIARSADASEPQNCRASTQPTADSVLKLAVTALGVDRLDGRVRMTTAVDLASDRFQADRMYAPYPYRNSQAQIAFDWSTGALRQGSLLSNGSAAVLVGPNGQTIPAANALASATRAMDPWAVIADWRTATDARVAQECLYRDYWRTVVTRTNGGIAERLFVDPKSGLPVKLERREPQSLFGDVLAEYVYTTWLKIGPVAMPMYTYRLFDGEMEQLRRAPQHALVPHDSAGNLTLPATAQQAVQQGIATPPPPDTVRVSATTFLLVQPAYTNVVTVQRDTIFVLDAQMNEARARADSVWIGKLFPGKHPVTLVVTDLAWPHIGGVRFWVANGARVYTHSASKAFLDTVLARHWTLNPDLLEQRRKTTRIAVRALERPIDLAGGALQLRAIDGFGSEGALMAYIPSERFLYAGDYIQQGSMAPPRPGLYDFTYPDEVIEAVRRNGFTPDRFAAMHVTLMSWPAFVEKRAALVR